MLKPATHISSGAGPAQVTAAPPSPARAGFARALQTVSSPPNSEVAVTQGDNLTKLVHTQAARHGVTLTDGQAHRWAQQVAQFNGLPDADRIYPGQRITLKPLSQYLAGLPSPAGRTAAQPAPAVAPESPAANVLASRTGTGLNPILSKVLERAVEKGYMPASETAAVGQKIAQLAKRHGFRPDDFARVAMMESDGLNPRATNGSCYGIIQFCDGPDRGAASVGHAKEPERIRSLSVLQQLDLVDAYLTDVGKAGKTRLSLDDLYLSILTPAAREEPRRHAALPIPAPQAAALHVGRDTSRPITRQSLVLGLYQHTQQALKP